MHKDLNLNHRINSRFNGLRFVAFTYTGSKNRHIWERRGAPTALKILETAGLNLNENPLSLCEQADQERIQSDGEEKIKERVVS